MLTLGQLRDRFSELLIDDQNPVMVTKDGVPLGFFLPARVWRMQEESELARELVELVLTGSGQTRGDIETCIDEAATRHHPLELWRVRVRTRP